MPRLAANLTLLFNEVPFPARFHAAAEAGFKAVEFLFPYEWPAADIKRWLEEADLELVLFNAPPGDWNAGDRGLACHPNRVDEFKKSIELALDYARILHPNNLHIMAGLTPKEGSLEEARDQLFDNLAWATARCSEEGIQALIEPLNLADNPGYFLNDFGVALEIIDNLKRPGHRNPGLQFDIYHCAKTHGTVVDWIKKGAPVIRHFQIADPAQRNEPSGQNLPLGEIFSTIDNLVGDAFVGCEYFPEKSTNHGLKWIWDYELLSF